MLAAAKAAVARQRTIARPAAAARSILTVARPVARPVARAPRRVQPALRRSSLLKQTRGVELTSRVAAPPRRQRGPSAARRALEMICASSGRRSRGPL